MRAEPLKVDIKAVVLLKFLHIYLCIENERREIQWSVLVSHSTYAIIQNYFLCARRIYPSLYNIF